MTSRGTWKTRERLVARFFGTERTPLSGGSSRHTRSDSLHPRLFIENKLRVKHSAVSLWDRTKKLAKREDKTPLVTLAEKGRPGFWVVVHSSDLQAVASEVANLPEQGRERAGRQGLFNDIDENFE